MHLQILLCTTLKPVVAIGALILPSTIYGILKVVPLSHLSWQCDVFGLMYLGWCLTFWTCNAYPVCSMYCSCFYWCAVHELISDLLACVLKKGFLIWKHFACSKLGPLLSQGCIYSKTAVTVGVSPILNIWLSNIKESRCWRKQCSIIWHKVRCFW